MAQAASESGGMTSDTERGPRQVPILREALSLGAPDILEVVGDRLGLIAQALNAHGYRIEREVTEVAPGGPLVLDGPHDARNFAAEGAPVAPLLLDPDALAAKLHRAMWPKTSDDYLPVGDEPCQRLARWIVEGGLSR